MQQRIEQLTEAQHADLRAWHAEYLAIGRCTDPADRPRAEAAISSMFAIIGEGPPQFLWVDSPATADLAIAFFERSPSLKSLQGSLRGSLRGSLWASLADSLRASLWASLWASLAGSLRDSLRASLGAWRTGAWWGQHEADWVAYYRFCEAIGVRYTAARARQLHLWDEIARSCGWWWPYRGLVIACERPAECHMEPFGDPHPFNGAMRCRLHRDDGPALLYRDGWPVHAVHGVRVPAEIVEQPESLTAKSIMAYSNAEVRRVAIERYGWDRFVGNAGLKLLDECPDPANDPYTLALYDASRDLLGFDGRVLLCVNASEERGGVRRRFGLTVPATCETALEAAAWTFGESPDTYAQLERAS